MGALLKGDVVANFWGEYKKSKDYKGGAREAIPAHYPSIVAREKKGLKMIYGRFIKSLLSPSNATEALRGRTIGDWLKEWLKMHDLLFKYVLRNRGRWREIDVRFGTPGDENLHKIPHYKKVPSEMNVYGKMVQDLLNKTYKDDADKIKSLAKIHYQFVRIHPFKDGNGRIARAITDQVAIYFGLPVAMVGYPRHNKKKRAEYHKAITACGTDPECDKLTVWVKSYIDIQLSRLA